MSLCSTISCLPCGKLFNETERKPCLGSCGHSICLLCKNSDNCPICERIDAFSGNVINWNSISVLDDIRKNLTEENYTNFSRNFESLDHGKCSECQSDCRKLRICTNCTKQSGLLAQLPNATWHMIESSEHSLESLERDFLKLKSLAVCANCFLDGQHQGHQFVNLKEVENISGHLEMRYLIAFGSIIEEKLGEDQEKLRVHRFKLRNRLEELKNLEETIKINGLESYPDLFEAKEKSYQKAKELNETNNKLRQELFKKHYSDQIEEKLTELVAEFRKTSFSDNMEYLIFKTIIKELQDAHNEQESNEKRLLESEDSYYALCLKKNQILTDLTDEERDLDPNSDYGQVRQMYISTMRRIIHVELVDKSLERDTFIWRLFQGSRRKLEAEIMKMHYFPECDCYFSI